MNTCTSSSNHYDCTVAAAKLHNAQATAAVFLQGVKSKVTEVQLVEHVCYTNLVSKQHSCELHDIIQVWC